MNKICGYSCEHNKSGICQISVCDKRPIMSDKTEIKHLSQSYYDLHEKYYKLQQENKILKENAENNDKVVDKVNWENMLLKKENEQLKDNWNKLKEWASNFYNSEEVGWAGCGMRYTLEKLQELEGSDSNE